MTMQHNKNYQYSIFNRFMQIMFLVFISIILYIGWKISITQKLLVHEKLVHISQVINQSVSSDIRYSEGKMRFISSIIANHDSLKNHKKTFNLLQEYSANDELNYGRMNIWHPIGWSNHKSINLINKPFKLCFGEVSTSYIDQRSIVTTSMGVIDKNDNHIGNIISAIDLESLSININSLINNNDYYYALVNTMDNKIIIKSYQFDDIKLTFDLEQLEFNSKKIRPYMLSKINNSPFILIIGTKQISLGYQDYLSLFDSYRLELLFIILILGSFIYLFYISFVRPLIALSKAAVATSNGELTTDLKEIYSQEGALIYEALEKITSSMKIEKDLVKALLDTRNDLSINNLRLEDKVLERTKELKNALEYKTIFLNQLNHEMILPMQGISSVAENLSSYWSEISEANKFEFASQIAYSSKRLLSITSNLLELSMFSSGNINMNITTFDLSVLTQEIIYENKMLCVDKKSMNINFLDDNSQYITADKDRISQVLRNLFVNAIRFSSDNGVISINIVPAKVSINNNYQEALHYMIHDRGIGLDELEIANIFMPFSQGKKVKTRPGSVGLGLSICREIILVHHGKIWATNNKDGGATFNFIIPINQPSKEGVNATDLVSKDLHHAKPNILIIDDEEVCLNSMELMLYHSKYNLVKASSGQEALKYLQQNYKSISLIMLDLMMPDMYGLNVLSEIKKNKNTAHIPVMLQTGTSDEEEIMKALNMGALSFVRKPYKKEMILDEIDKALKISYT